MLKKQITQFPSANSTVCVEICEMERHMEEQLISLLKSRKFSLKLHETTLRNNNALLMAYVRFWNASELMEEMLLCSILTTFEEIRSYSNESDIPLDNIISCATDGAASMAARCRGCIAHLKLAAAGDDRAFQFMRIISNRYARKGKKHFMTS
ncbi:hypothetical protein M514_11222 [Trichuris suis]|uniref:DUF4371 domain-containing protein n=1 Tax=Trichuris suis TaxID=68888 RepID=A0A085LSI5_9BILA|nr:hypothetical protein M513_11222 [Trichuris suis]KFD68002.1 hypothetical protein M514_11222 [Trichuris suis]